MEVQWISTVESYIRQGPCKFGERFRCNYWDIYCPENWPLSIFIFRGLATFQKENVGIEGRQLRIYFNSKIANLASHSIIDHVNKSISSELDKVLKGNRGDTITLEAYFNENGAKFSRNSTYFAAFLLEE